MSTGDPATNERMRPWLIEAEREDAVTARPLGGGAILGIDHCSRRAFRELPMASLSVATVRTRVERALKNGRTIVQPFHVSW